MTATYSVRCLSIPRDHNWEKGNQEVTVAEGLSFDEACTVYFNVQRNGLALGFMRPHIKAEN